MPFAGVITMAPHDNRLSGATTPTYTADATWEAGFYGVAASSGAPAWSADPVTTFSLGDGDTAYLYWEGGFDRATTWAPGVDEPLAQLSSSAGRSPSLHILRKNDGKMYARLTDANGTNHDTPGYTLPSTAVTDHNVWGASVKRYTSAGSIVVDVVLRDITGATDVATLTADAIAGADKTLSFAQLRMGLLTTFGKGGTGSARFGRMQVHASSAVTLDSGTAWSNADVDSVVPRMISKQSSGTAQVAAVGCITVYDTSATGDTWPSTTTTVSFRLPTGDSTPLQWTPQTGPTNYTNVDDAFGSYSATDYVSAASSSLSDEYSYTALNLSGKTVLGFGFFYRQIASIAPEPSVLMDLGGGSVSAEKAPIDVTRTVWRMWNLKPAAIASPVGNIVSLNQSVNRAATY